MPAIDLARLRKQANRLADFFFLPDDFMKHLREMLDFYVNHTLRKKENIAPGSNLPTYRTPPVVMRQIENAIGPHRRRKSSLCAGTGRPAVGRRLHRNPPAGRLPAWTHPARRKNALLARLTAWTQQVRDPSVRAALLTTSLTRMRKETPDEFLVVVGEWLHPARQQLLAERHTGASPDDHRSKF